MILHTYPANFSEPADSPFCVKAMCLLQMSGLKWTANLMSDPRKMPNQKLPVLQDGETLIADSGQIADHLQRQTGKDFNAGLTDMQKAQSTALVRMVEEHLYFALMVERWRHPENWKVVKAAYFADVPKLLRGLIAGSVRKQALGQTMAQGIGRHTDAERLKRADADIAAIETLLGDQDFLFGAKVTLADVSVAPILAALAVTPVPTPVTKLVSQNENLTNYTRRVAQATYPTSIDFKK